MNQKLETVDKITWEQKVEMVRMGNLLITKEGRTAFYSYVSELAHKFDAQAWSMFITTVELVPSELLENKDLVLKIWDGMLASADLKTINLGLRDGIRIGVFKAICLDFKNGGDGKDL